MRNILIFTLVILLCYNLVHGQTWTQVEGSAAEISVGPGGAPCIVKLNGDIYNQTADGWSKLPGKATDIGVGANYGDTWAIGTNKIAGGYGVFQYSPSTNKWNQVKGGLLGGVRIAVDPQGDPWFVDDAGKIYRRNAVGFFQFTTGLATDIGIGANGDAWVIGTIPASGGFGIYYYSLATSNWEAVDGAAVRIAVDPQGNPWVVNDVGKIYRRVSDEWQEMPGTARDIGIGGNGDVWIVGTDQEDEEGYSILKFSE